MQGRFSINSSCMANINEIDLQQKDIQIIWNIEKYYLYLSDYVFVHI